MVIAGEEVETDDITTILVVMVSAEVRGMSLYGGYKRNVALVRGNISFSLANIMYKQ